MASESKNTFHNYVKFFEPMKFDGTDWPMYEHEFKLALEFIRASNVIDTAPTDGDDPKLKELQSFVKLVIPFTLEKVVKPAILQCKTAYDMWTTLSKIYSKKGLIAEAQLMNEMESLRYNPGLSVTEFINSITLINFRLAKVGGALDDKALAKFIIKCFTRDAYKQYSNPLFALNELGEDITMQQVREYLVREESNIHYADGPMAEALVGAKSHHARTSHINLSGVDVNAATGLCPYHGSHHPPASCYKLHPNLKPPFNKSSTHNRSSTFKPKMNGKHNPMAKSNGSANTATSIKYGDTRYTALFTESNGSTNPVVTQPLHAVAISANGDDNLHQFYLDSGSTFHLVNDKSLLFNFSDTVKQSVITGNGSLVHTAGCGDLKMNIFDETSNSVSKFIFIMFTIALISR